ncbi:CxxxxCH/CxxCH domain-containing protein, partial [Listeria monocytogenes]
RSETCANLSCHSSSAVARVATY